MFHSQWFQLFLRDMSWEEFNISGQSSLKSKLAIVNWLNFVLACLLQSNQVLRHYLKMFIVKGIIGGQNLIINYVKKILKFPNVQMLSYVCYILLYIPQWEATSCCWGTRRPQKEVWWELFLWICTKSYLPLLPNPVHTNAMHYAFEYVFPAILLFNKIEIKKNIF